MSSNLLCLNIVIIMNTLFYHRKQFALCKHHHHERFAIMWLSQSYAILFCHTKILNWLSYHFVTLYLYIFHFSYSIQCQYAIHCFIHFSYPGVRHTGVWNAAIQAEFSCIKRWVGDHARWWYSLHVSVRNLCEAYPKQCLVPTKDYLAHLYNNTRFCTLASDWVEAVASFVVV